MFRVAGRMDRALAKTVLYQVRRNFLSVLFPTITASVIYADWSHTQHYKAAKAAQVKKFKEDL